VSLLDEAITVLALAWQFLTSHADAAFHYTVGYTPIRDKGNKRHPRLHCCLLWSHMHAWAAEA